MSFFCEEDPPWQALWVWTGTWWERPVWGSTKIHEWQQSCCLSRCTAECRETLSSVFPPGGISRLEFVYRCCEDIMIYLSSKKRKALLRLTSATASGGQTLNYPVFKHKNNWMLQDVHSMPHKNHPTLLKRFTFSGDTRRRRSVAVTNPEFEISGPVIQHWCQMMPLMSRCPLSRLGVRDKGQSAVWVSLRQTLEKLTINV